MRLLRLVLVGGLLGGLAAPTAAQTLTEDVHLLVRRDGSVYLVHTLPVASGEGTMVYRRVDGGPEQRLTEQPLRPVASGAELRQALGPLADEVRARMRVGALNEGLLRMRARPVVGALYSYLYPEIAEALGRGFFDLEAPRGAVATYRVVIVDDLGRPVGREVAKTVPLVPFTAPPPTDLTATHEGRRVTLRWSYASTHPIEVVAFQLYGGRPGGGHRLGLHRLTRNRAHDAFEVTFDVPAFASASFYLTAMDLSGQESAPSEVLTYRITDNEAPAVVTSVTATEHPRGGLAIDWTPIEGVDPVAYRVLRSRQVAGPFAVVGEVPVARTAFHDREATPGRSYAYRVVAVDAAGNTSPPSLAATIRYRDRQAPEAPGALEATAQDDTLVTLTWAPSPAADLRTYVLLRRRLGRGGVPVATRLNSEAVTAGHFIDTGEAGRGFVEGATYVFGVAAMDSSRNVSDTVLTRVRIPDNTPPEAPSTLRAKTDGFRVALTWNPSGSADAAHYRLYRSEGTDSTPDSLIRDIRPQRTFARDEAVHPGVRYRYHLTAVDAAGNESAPSEVATILMRDGVPPRQVRGVQGMVLGDGVRVAWEPARVDDLVGYHVFRAEQAAGPYQRVTADTLAETSWTDPQGTRGLWYRVRAVDTSGLASRPSRPAQAHLQTPPP